MDFEWLVHACSTHKLIAGLGIPTLEWWRESTLDERVAEEFATKLSGDLGSLGALGGPEELWSAFKTTVLDVAGGSLGTHRRAQNIFVSQGTLDTIDQSRRARLNGRAELFRELRRKTTCAKGGQGGLCARNL